MCNGCKCVYYCGVACQKDRRREHKRDCKPIKNILESRGNCYKEGAKPLEPLSRDDIPPTEDCPICMLPLPSKRIMATLMSCCGKTICGACINKHIIVSSLASRQNDGPIELNHNCVFCRAPAAETDEDILKSLMARAEKNDAQALGNLGSAHIDGGLGLPVDKAKGLEFPTRAATLGDDQACFELAHLYRDGEDGVVVCHKVKAEILKCTSSAP